MPSEVTIPGSDGTDTSTVGFTIAPAPNISETRTEARLLREDVGFGRIHARALNGDWDELHVRTHLREWEARTSERGRSSPVDMLNELADLGFAWRDLARILDVSVPSIQKWRRGAGVTGENRRKIAAFLGGCDLVIEDYEVQEVASWFEMQIFQLAPVTPLDLWQGARPDLVFEYASGHAEPDQILSSFDQHWRETYRSDFESFMAADGHRSIRPRGSVNGD